MITGSPERTSDIFSTILESGTLLIGVFDHEGRILEFSGECERTTGYSAAEVRGKVFWDIFIIREEVELVRQQFAKVLEDEKPVRFEHFCVLKDGRRRLVAGAYSLVKNSNSGAAYVVGTGVDLTEMRAAQKELAEGYSRDRAIFNTAIEAIITISEKGIVQSFNPAAERLFGYQADQMIGRNVSVLMPDPYSHEHDTYLANYLRTGQAKIIGIGREVTGRRKDGTVFPASLAVTELKTREGRGFAGFMQDLSERKEHERQVERWREELERQVQERTAELAQANEEMEHFAYILSHDLQTPLRGIHNYVDFITEDIRSGAADSACQNLERLGRAADQLNTMVSDLLEYSRIGRSDLEFIQIDTRQLIDEIVRSMVLEPDCRVEIKTDLPRIWAPLTLLRQVFQNLIENGLKYNRSPEKVLEISAEALPGNPRRWRFAFRDNGIGIDPEHHGTIFQMFKRLHSSKTYPGTGIGLTTVRKSLQQLGGTIKVESAPGSGSIFIVDLPEQHSTNN